MANTASQKVKISMEAKGQDDKIFSRYRLFLMGRALHFGLRYFFVEKTDGNIDVLVAGEEEGVQRFYEILGENLREYRVDGITPPEAYSENVPTIDMFLLLTRASEAHNYAEAVKKAAKEINKTQEKIQ